MSNGFTFDPIENRFFNQRIKVPLVVCQEQVQEFGDITIPAPLGVTIDPITGLLQQSVTLQLAGTPQLRTVTVLPDKVINQGAVPVALFVNGVLVVPLIEIPFQAVVDCPGARPGDIVQKHDFQVEGFSVAPIRVTIGIDLPVNLILKVVVKFCLVVTSERILKINTAETFC